MNFNENDLWRDKTELLNLRLSKLPRTKFQLKLEFDSKDQVLSCLVCVCSTLLLHHSLALAGYITWYQQYLVRNDIVKVE